MFANLLMWGVVVLLALGLAVFGPVSIPSVLNIAASSILAIKLTKRWVIRIPLLIGFSGLFSLALRAPSLISGDEDRTQIEIAKQTVVGPRDKLVLDLEDEYVFYRRRTDPPTVGLYGDWRFGIVPLDTIHEKPESILTELGIAHTRTGQGASTLRIRTTEKGGLMVVSAEVLQGTHLVATYIHTVRKSYLLEQFDYSGRFKEGDWRPVFLYFSQDTFWIPRRELFPENHRPLRAFIRAAIAQGGESASGAKLVPVADPLNFPERARSATAVFHIESALERKNIPPNHLACEGEDAGQRFTVEGEAIRWKDSEIPRIQVPRSAVDGYFVFPTAIICDTEANSFWFAAYHMDVLHLWKYRVDFLARGLRLEKWLRIEPSPEAKELFRSLPNRIAYVGAIRGETAELYVVTVDHSAIRPVGNRGYRVDVSLNQ